MSGRPGVGTVERLAPTGEGVVHEAGKVVFVEGALPGETVAFEIAESHRRWARAETRAVLSPSPDRAAVDPHSSVCGGEDWAHFLSGPARRAKVDLFAESMARLGGLDAGGFRAADISESPSGYRLRSQFHLAWVDGRAIAGFYRRRSHDVVPLEACSLISEIGRRKLGAWLADRSAEDVRRWPTIYTAETIDTGPGHVLAACGPEETPVLPDLPAGVMIETAGFRFDVAPASFFQINRFRLEPFFQRIEELIEGEAPRSVLEIGAGAGFLTCAAARSRIPVIAVEPSPDAAAAGRRNLAQNGIGGRARFLETSAERYLDSYPTEFDLVLADPPREGLGAAAARLARLAARSFLYVSCEPATLARDLKSIVAESFELSALFLEDFFPRTHRVEAIVLLRRR